MNSDSGKTPVQALHEIIREAFINIPGANDSDSTWEKFAARVQKHFVILLPEEYARLKRIDDKIASNIAGGNPTFLAKTLFDAIKSLPETQSHYVVSAMYDAKEFNLLNQQFSCVYRVIALEMLQRFEIVPISDDQPAALNAETLAGVFYDTWCQSGTVKSIKEQYGMPHWHQLRENAPSIANEYVAVAQEICDRYFVLSKTKTINGADYVTLSKEDYYRLKDDSEQLASVVSHREALLVQLAKKGVADDCVMVKLDEFNRLTEAADQLRALTQHKIILANSLAASTPPAPAGPQEIHVHEYAARALATASYIASHGVSPLYEDANSKRRKWYKALSAALTELHHLMPAHQYEEMARAAAAANEYHEKLIAAQRDLVLMSERYDILFNSINSSEVIQESDDVIFMGGVNHDGPLEITVTGRMSDGSFDGSVTVPIEKNFAPLDTMMRVFTDMVRAASRSAFDRPFIEEREARLAAAAQRAQAEEALRQD